MKTISKEHSDTMLRSSIDNMNQLVILVIDRDYKYTYFNKLHESTMRDVYDVEVKLGSDIFDFITVQSDKEIQKLHYDLALEGKPTTNVDRYGENNDMYFETFYNPVYIEGKVVGVSVTSLNVTERIMNEYSKSDSTEKLSKIYSSMPQAYSLVKLMFDERGKPINFIFTEVNFAYEELFDRRSENIIGKSIREISPGVEQEWISRLGDIAVTGESAYFEGYTGVIDKFLSTFAYSPQRGYVAALTIDVNDDYNGDENNKLGYVELGSLNYNTRTNEIRVGVKSINLNYMEAKFFYLLLSKSSGLVTYKEALEEMHVDSLTDLRDLMKVYVHRLRRKLAILDCKDVEIKSHYGKGYSIILKENA